MRISDWSSDVCSSDLLGDFDSRIKRAPRSAQVAREHCDGKIGPAAHFVYFVDWLIGRFEYIAGLRDQIPSRREAADTDLAGVDLELTGARAHQTYRTLGVLQRTEVARKSVVQGQRVSVRVNIVGTGRLKKKIK